MRILLVEDNEDTSLALTQLLKSDEFEVLTAANGKIGYNLACKSLPGVIVTDVMMPELDGLSLIKQLRATPATALVPIIAISAHGNKTEVLSAGANLYLEKPFDYAELVTAIRQVTTEVKVQSATGAEIAR